VRKQNVRLTPEAVEIMELALEERVKDIIANLARISAARAEVKKTQQYARCRRDSFLL
jgi:hypothetical protein